MGRNPLIAAPTASPVRAASDVGVSSTRSGYFCLSPAVVPAAPWGTPNPRMNTRGSVSSSCSVASLIASVYLVILLGIQVGIEFLLGGIRRVQGKCYIFHDSRLYTLFDRGEFFLRKTALEEPVLHFGDRVLPESPVEHVLIAVIFVHQRSAVRHVAVGQTLEHCGALTRSYTVYQYFCFYVDILVIISVRFGVPHPEPGRYFFDIIAVRAAVLYLRIYGKKVVFDDKQKRHLEERGEIICFVYHPFFGSAVAIKGHCDIFCMIVLL